MTPVQLTTYVRYLTKTDITTLTDAEILLLAAIKMDDISEQILDANEDYFGVPETTDLVADQREYPFPTDMLSEIKRVEVAFDPTTPLAYVKLGELDLTSYPHGTDEATIISHFTNNEGEAFYDIFRKAIRIFSGTIVDVVNGIRLWTYQYPTHITDLTSTVDMSIDPTTTTAGFPKPFHELLGRAISIMYKGSKQKPIPLTEQEQLYEAELLRKINAIKKLNLDREVIGTIPFNNGSQY